MESALLLENTAKKGIGKMTTPKLELANQIQINGVATK